MEDNIVSLTHS